MFVFRPDSSWVGALNARQKGEFEKRMAQALGVEYTAIFDDKGLFDAAEAAAIEASRLIRTIPEDY
jgi:hypothetical protein